MHGGGDHLERVADDGRKLGREVVGGRGAKQILIPIVLVPLPETDLLLPCAEKRASCVFKSAFEEFESGFKTCLLK